MPRLKRTTCSYCGLPGNESLDPLVKGAHRACSLAWHRRYDKEYHANGNRPLHPVYTVQYPRTGDTFNATFVTTGLSHRDNPFVCAYTTSHSIVARKLSDSSEQAPEWAFDKRLWSFDISRD